MPMPLADIRRELPVTQRLAYLNTGSVGPLPRSSVRAMTGWVERQLLEGRADFKVFVDEHFPLLDEVRGRFARLLGADDDEVAVTHHTTEGLNIALWGLRWRPGDEIVTTSLEFEGGLVPAYAIARHYGITLKMVPLRLGQGDIAGQVAAALSPRTRVVLVSHVSYRTGAVLPVAEIAEAAHRVGALVVVDGAQSAGAIPVNVHELGLDAYAIPGHKWLCGVEGVGALYVRRERLAEFEPTFVGLLSVRDFTAFDMSGYFIPAPGARRYEVSTLYWPGLHGMGAALRWLEETVGYDLIFERTQSLTRRCREMLTELPGATLLSPGPHAGLTTFSLGRLDAKQAADSLSQSGVLIRSISDPPALRASTGFFNNDEDLARLREGLLGLAA